MKLFRILDEKLEEYLCAALLGLLTVLMWVQVYMRFVMGTGFSWGEELSRIVFVWLMYIAASLGVKRNAHIRITSFLGLFPEKLRNKIVMLSDIIWLVFSVWVLIISLDMLKTMFKYPQISPSLLINTAWSYLVIPIAFGMMIFRLLQLYCKNLKAKG